MGWFRATFAALSIVPFRILWFGTLFSFMAFFMSTVVQSVVAFELLGTNRAVGYVVAAQGVAMVLLGPLGGAYADRLPKKLVVALCQTVTTLVFALLALAVATDSIRIAHLALGSLMMGIGFSFQGPARQALVIELVPEQRRGNAMALAQIANTASRVAGPVVAGVLLAWSFSGATGAYGTMSGLYAISALTLSLLPRSPARANSAETHVLTDLREGLRYTRRHPRLRVVVPLSIAVITVGFPYVTVLPGLVENQLGRDVESISTLYTVTAVGALAASLGVARFADSPRAALLFASMGLLFGSSLLALAAVPTYEAAIGAVFVLGVGSGGFQALSGAVVARESDPAYMGRVMSLTLLAFGFFGLMGLPLGLIADAAGERAALGANGVAVIACVAAGWMALARSSAPAPPTPDRV